MPPARRPVPDVVGAAHASPSRFLNSDESQQPGTAAPPSPQPSPPVPGERVGVNRVLHRPDAHLSLSRVRERVGANRVLHRPHAHLSPSRLRERVGVRVPASPQKRLLRFIANQVAL